MRKTMWFQLAISAVAVLTPAWTMAGETEDNALASRIAASLKQSGRLQSYRIGVTCKDGTAVLEGDVTSNEQGIQALQLTRQTPGVKEVVNRLMCPNEPEAQLTSSEMPALGQPMPPQQMQQMQQMQMARQPMPGQQMAMPASAMQAMPMGPTPAMPMASQPMGAPVPAYVPGAYPPNPARYDQPYMPNYSWPSYAAYPNYAAVTYPKQYSPTAWPYIGPFYPYPQVPLGWRKVTLEWDDGWWMLDFKD